MYHCHIHFYLAGSPCRVLEAVKEMSPLEHFTHEFFESNEPDEVLASKADVIMVNLQDMNEKEIVQMLIGAKRKETELILLADKRQIGLLGEFLPEIKDIWTMPMSEEEMRFHFLRWQQTCKMSKD